MLELARAGWSVIEMEEAGLFFEHSQDDTKIRGFSRLSKILFESNQQRLQRRIRNELPFAVFLPRFRDF